MRISDWSSDVCSSDLEQRAELIALAPQSDDQHATRIGVLRERREQRARMAEIVAKLRTTEGVLERMDAVDAPRMARARDPRDARGEVADAADGRQDPDFVARPGAAVGTEIARKGPGGSGDGRCTDGGRRVTKVRVAAQAGRPRWDEARVGE